jgi:isoquinoline 1-oxidoreductase beta subunit
MIHPPKFGATLTGFDASKAAGIKGFVEAVATPRGVAVLGDSMWSALQAREVVTATWDESKAEQRGSAEILVQYRALVTQPPKATARKDGEGAAAMAKAARVIEATFEFPYLAHAALEPLNAVVRRAEDGTIEIWGGHQMPDIYQAVAAQVAGTTPDKIRLHVMKTGGGFGRRAVPDADIIVEAVAAARAINWRAPVKVQWTRENDMAGGRYRPAYVHRLRAGLDASGAVIAWDNHIVGQSIMANSPFADMITNGVDPTSVEGSSNLPYAIPNLEVGLTTTDAKVPVLWWRAVGSTHTAYATEVFLDEIARASGKDPVALRLSLLDKHPRHAAALKLVAERAGWGSAPPAGRHRGVAVHESFGSVVAEIAEVSVTGAAITVHKVWCAVDCGVAINPDTIKAQMEGGIGFGLGAILQEELTLTAGRVDQSNYDTYRPLRIDQMPQVEVHIVPSTNPPSGVGEPGTPPIGAAVANAVLAATGKAVRTLPISKGLTS